MLENNTPCTDPDPPCRYDIEIICKNHSWLDTWHFLGQSISYLHHKYWREI
uniref:Uncharacterized protein MANES_12G027100 n=1 Tax=Rhizophora mucronata TaxID=61149 RepID=A0A2P2K1Q5_RHIMU